MCRIEQNKLTILNYIKIKKKKKDKIYEPIVTITSVSDTNNNNTLYDIFNPIIVTLNCYF